MQVYFTIDLRRLAFRPVATQHPGALKLLATLDRLANAEFQRGHQSAAKHWMRKTIIQEAAQ